MRQPAVRTGPQRCGGDDEDAYRWVTISVPPHLSLR